jgi:hypothetical protein
MELSDKARAFLEKNHGAAMITLRPDGSSHAVRVGIALVDGKIWSSGVPGRARTRYLQRDPRSTLFVYEQQGYGFLSLECETRILEGPDMPEKSYTLFDVMQAGREDKSKLAWNGKPLSREAFLQAMVDEHRLIYEFEVKREYGFGY